jgi:cephalosporin hydroxylase
MTALQIKQHLRELKFHPSLIAVRQLRKYLSDAYPSLLVRLNRSKRAALLKEFDACSSVNACIEFTRRHMAAGSCQIPWEIESAIRLIGDARPRILCEIGTFDGGTSLLFSRFLPSLETVLCIDLFVKNKEMLRLLARPNQQLRFFDRPSYSKATVAMVDEFLDGRMIDVLFIDGDHRYEGVKQDFLCYRQFVKNRGLILFHDIVEDKGGKRAWAGGVPKFWKEVAPAYRHFEFIHDRNQKGFGIGALIYSRPE